MAEPKAPAPVESAGQSQRVAVWVGLVIFWWILGSINVWFKPLQSLDNVWLDHISRSWINGLDRHSDDIVIIDVDDASLGAMANVVGRWPWPRSVHAELLEAILAQQPKAVVFDILFSEKDLYRPDADAYFAEVMGGANNLFLPALHVTTNQDNLYPVVGSYPEQAGIQPAVTNAQPARANLLLPWALPATVWKLGTINLAVGNDGIGRAYEVRHRFGDWYMPSLPARVISSLRSLPEQDDFLMFWLSGDEPFSRHPYASVFQQVYEGKPYLSDQYFKDKIVVIGATATGLGDIQATPMSGTYPGVYILSTAMHNLLHEEQLHRAHPLAVWLLTMLGILLLARSCWRARQGGAAVAMLLVWLLVLPVVSYAFLVWQQMLLGVVSIMLILLATFISLITVQFFIRQQAYRHAIDIFGRFMDPEVVKQLVQEGRHQALMQPKTVRATVLFSDIRNFTTLSEQHTAGEIVDMLNAYFSRQVKVMFSHEGTLDKFIGDAIMAFWGAPLAVEHAEIKAVSAALDMIEQLAEFRAESGLDGFDIGIGIHTGDLVVGAIGSERRYDYTAIGDAVNLASRIEGLTKDLAHILVSDETRKACGEAFDFVQVGTYKVKGRDELVTVYQPKRWEKTGGEVRDDSGAQSTG